MESVQGNASFQGIQTLIREMEDKAYRTAFVEQFNRQLLARQMRGFRGEQSQADYGEKIGKSQTQIARFEDPLYGWQMRSVFEIVRKQDVAVIMCFVDHGTFLKFEQMSEDLLTPEPFDIDRLRALIARKDNDTNYAGGSTETTGRPPHFETVPSLIPLSALNSIGSRDRTANVGGLELLGANVLADYSDVSGTMDQNSWSR